MRILLIAAVVLLAAFPVLGQVEIEREDALSVGSQVALQNYQTASQLLDYLATTQAGTHCVQGEIDVGSFSQVSGTLCLFEDPIEERLILFATTEGSSLTARRIIMVFRGGELLRASFGDNVYSIEPVIIASILEPGEYEVYFSVDSDDKPSLVYSFFIEGTE